MFEIYVTRKGDKFTVTVNEIEVRYRLYNLMLTTVIQPIKKKFFQTFFFHYATVRSRFAK